jgi:hypothetical protein
MTVSHSPWNLKDFEARLALGGLAGQIDVRYPFDGLAAMFGGANLRLFRIELPPPSADVKDQSPECYVRGQDLVSIYLQDDKRKIRGQVYWRALECGPNRAPGIDLIVSVQTSLLDSDPTLNVRSNVPAREVLGVRSLERATTNDITPRGGDSRTVSMRSPMPACWLFRLTVEETTYVEMVHPHDFVYSMLKESAPGEIEHSTQLFSGSLEKGVILRSRLRGVLVPRTGDVAAAVACYREFAASEPPLTA